MRIAFTAPMKPLDHPVPSGDRTMGRLIVKALESLGHEVTIASRFRSWRKDGSDSIQSEVRDQALIEAERISADWLKSGYRPDLFLTYHLYHKAPDWIGPALADRFNLPYAIVEASRAPKRQQGDWAFGFAAADEALMRADAVAALHNADAECLAAVVPHRCLSILLPFLDADPFLAAATNAKPLAAPPLKLLAVGMMREGDKQRSFEVLAAALEELRDLPWQLTLIGDGPMRDHVLGLFPAERINWLGALAGEDLPAQYARHDLLVWPAIREAFGLVLLEAQAAGVGVIAGDTFGVPDIVRDCETGLLSPEGDASALAANLRRAMLEPALVDRLGSAARNHILHFHTLPAGAARLEALAEKAVRNHLSRQETKDA
ncbi:putative glycosyltransferase protein [Stappia aggregata IAM 12614]|uniref:Putative glycosyltransferase protein n=1 Tax=Roseibium aggregatum (strain ATCC 25650 / DSM 13394 / JCM 20685 / NBRC 16684 / NCIMB 2208 / IAM 12614 / B1) TaxID=384765 RepID=A0NLU4_ROSAI|nr:glycosyltransferase family 4 protein [Roseibium aggregatum]EAV46039.1 putative glycosyltransferase protein [Stappia aggregata IAM 12614] [Roseibium aggregatum IAM 12614]